MKLKLSQKIHKNREEFKRGGGNFFSLARIYSPAFILNEMIFFLKNYKFLQRKRSQNVLTILYWLVKILVI